MDELDFFTEKDKKDVSYGMCVTGIAVTGMAVGASASVGVGALPGFIVGGIIGLKTCNRLSPILKKKIFSEKAALSENELSEVLKQLRQENPNITKQEALYSFSQMRETMNKLPWDFKAVV